jgi:type VI secretion system protein ImpK
VAEPTLARLAGDFFATVLLVADAPEGPGPDPANLRGQLVNRLDALSRHPAVQAVEAQELDDARFALVAWADEVLLRSHWPGRDEWAQELLQTRLFRTNRGGDEMYERLARLRPDQSAARRIFLLCFAFGFEGQLVDQPQQRQALIQQSYDMLRAAGQLRDLVGIGRLSPEAYELEVQLKPPSSGGITRVLLLWGGAAALLFVLLWAVLAVLAAGVPVPAGA